jgi:ABC-2 type transport system ATP-binding protein
MADSSGLSLKELSRSYGQKTAVDHLSLNVHRGEVFGLLGPNGAGKTTTLKMIAGLVIPDSGEIRLDGAPVESARSSIAYVPDEPAVFPNLSGREYLLYTGRLRGIRHQVLQERISVFERLFEMDRWLDGRAGSYSHGMIQRVVLSSAFIARPSLFVIDEPLVGLDPPAAETFWRLAEAAAASGAAVMISTHTLSVASANCTRFGIISKGKMLKLITRGELSGSDLQSLFFSITGTAPADVRGYFLDRS